jgi:putative ABC transport system permease protein
MRGVPFEVVGVAVRKGSILGQSKDNWAVMPWPSYERVFGRTRNNNIAIVASSPEDMPKAIDEVVAKLRRLRGLAPQDENDFDWYSNDTAAELFNNLAAMVAAATGGICALALLVGGIGIMNIMLVSVTERTREIGIRLAIGALEREVLAQFLVEAVVLASFGGVTGIALALLASWGLTALLGVPFVFMPGTIALAFLFSAAIGIGFGFFPARRAAQLDPIEALRHE